MGTSSRAVQKANSKPACATNSPSEPGLTLKSRIPSTFTQRRLPCKFRSPALGLPCTRICDTGVMSSVDRSALSHSAEERFWRDVFPPGKPSQCGRLAEASSIRNSARWAWYLAADRLPSEHCMTAWPSIVQRYHRHARPRFVSRISKRGSCSGIVSCRSTLRR